MPEFIQGNLLGNDQVPAMLARIELYDGSDGSLGSMVSATTTGIDGEYILPALPGQTHGFLRLVPGLFNEHWWDPEIVYPSSWSCRGPALIAFSDLDPAGHLGTQSAQYSFINGRVEDSATGQPLAGVSVHLREAGGGAVLYSTRTDAAGKFLFANLACYPTDDEEYSLYLSGYSIGYETGWYWPGAPTPAQVVNRIDHSTIDRGPVLRSGAIPLDRLSFWPRRPPWRPIPLRGAGRLRRKAGQRPWSDGSAGAAEHRER